MKKRKKVGYPQESSDDGLKKMSHAKVQSCKSQIIIIIIIIIMIIVIIIIMSIFLERLSM